MDRVNAQQARRILDRLVGYKISPLLWSKVRSGLSAGRVQSVAVKLIVDREREIEAFVPKEYWTIAALLARPRKRPASRPNSRPNSSRHRGEKLEITQRGADATQFFARSRARPIASRRSSGAKCAAIRRRRSRRPRCSKRLRAN